MPDHAAWSNADYECHQAGRAVAAVAETLGVTYKIARKCRDRFAAEGNAGMAGRSSRPHPSPTRPGGQAEEVIECRDASADRTGIGRPLSPAGVVLIQHDLGRLRALDLWPTANTSNVSGREN
jgi:hypothetical protein